MTLNAKAMAILSAAGIAATVLASPVMAQTYRAPSNGQAQSVYGADRPVPPHAHNRSVNPDFQLGSEKSN